MAASKPRNRAADLAVYLLVRLAVCAVQALPARLAYALADALARLLHAAAGRLRRTARDNLAAAYPELAADPAAADRAVRAVFRHFLRAAVELALFPRKFRPGTWRRYVAVPDGDRLLGPIGDSRPALIVTAHLGNWELAGVALGRAGFRTHAVARPLDNPHLDRFVRRLRQSAGQRLIAKNGEFDQLDAVLRAGGTVATLADQDAGPRGVFVSFFGRLASTHKAIALLALQYDAVLVVTGVARVPRAGHPAPPPAAGLGPMFYAVTLEDLIDPRGYAGRGRAAAVRAITERYTAALERLVRRHPDQYLWPHRRWKTRPPERAADRAA
jgi:KDO2-lipid IV(A) lauroyltransferase